MVTKQRVPYVFKMNAVSSNYSCIPAAAVTCSCSSNGIVVVEVALITRKLSLLAYIDYDRGHINTVTVKKINEAGGKMVDMKSEKQVCAC